MSSDMHFVMPDTRSKRIECAGIVKISPMVTIRCRFTNNSDITRSEEKGNRELGVQLKASGILKAVFKALLQSNDIFKVQNQ
jgi:hypothetical protein